METVWAADGSTAIVGGSRRSLARPPVPLTSLLAREQEIVDVSNLIRRDDVRLLTLTGPGGVGKTRLAIAVANAMAADGPSDVAFVALAPVRDPDLVTSTIAQALGIAESGKRSAQAQIVAALSDAELLLVLDNFEHVLDAAPFVGELLHACPRLTILTTSRAALHVSGEREYPVPPLALPTPDAPLPGDVADVPAVRLFVERATAVDPSFTLTSDNAAAITAICTRLDGLPLAIELAAARSKILPPSLLLPRLARQLPLLTGGPRDVPARLQTMYDAIAWSHDLLTVDEQQLFRRLAVFSGGFALEAAEQVCRGIEETTQQPSAPTAREPGLVTTGASFLDGIASLVDKSLLQRTNGRNNGDRLGMLETIREFAQERLQAAGEGEVAQAAHAAYFLGLEAWLDPNHVEPGEHVDDRLWRIEAEYANFRVALDHMADADDGEGVLRLSGALAIFWHQRGKLTEGRRWLEWALDHTAEALSASRSRALAGLSLILWSQGHNEPAGPLASAARAIAEAIGHTELAALAIHILGLVALAEAEWDRAAAFMAEARGLWRVVGLPSDEAWALKALSQAAYATGDAAASVRHAEEALAIFRALGHPSGAASALSLIARVTRDHGDDHAAAAAYQEGLQLWSRTDARWSSAGGYPGTDELALFPLWTGIDDRRTVLRALIGLAGIAADHGQAELAAMFIGAVDVRLDQSGFPLYPGDHVSHDWAVTAARATLGEAPFAAARAAGEKLRLDEAVVLASTISVPDQTNRKTGLDGAVPSAYGLTPRETDVLRLVALGQTDQAIADTLFLSRRTVNAHVAHIFAKLDVRTRREAADRANDLGLLPPGEPPRYT
jgi:predicted ATPase/DNA-binding CsgD family transcriptional regulator